VIVLSSVCVCVFVCVFVYWSWIREVGEQMKQFPQGGYAGCSFSLAPHICVAKCWN
jgi:hypothetical protein